MSKAFHRLGMYIWLAKLDIIPRYHFVCIRTLFSILYDALVWVV